MVGPVQAGSAPGRPAGSLGRWRTGPGPASAALVTGSLRRCRPPPPAETALWAGVGGGPWVGAGAGAAGPGGWVEERAAQGQGDGERQPCAEQAGGVHGDEGEVAGGEPVGQPDGVAAGVGGEEAARDLTRGAAGEHLPCLQKRGEGGEHAVGGRRGAEELRGAGEHGGSLFHWASWRLGYRLSGCCGPGGGLFLLAAGAGRAGGLGPGPAGHDGGGRAKDGHAGRREQGGTEAVVEAGRGAGVPV